ncbi:hypothetical protein F5878DRAFT_385266 [Lentinula raphanica]|uniref:Uncharacterized protein n=1 Tax=Lentinula raphanica TaxID=153919 RepID=A0AA38U7P5_9AGAR|nr:hypothetical protein F5878DRAFT_385266 [Lentinula raphanica]
MLFFAWERLKLRSIHLALTYVPSELRNSLFFSLNLSCQKTYRSLLYFFSPKLLLSCKTFVHLKNFTYIPSLNLSGNRSPTTDYAIRKSLHPCFYPHPLSSSSFVLLAELTDMADLGDFIALIVTIAVFAGIIYLAYTVTSSVSDSVKSTKDRLKEKGYEISNQGMSVKTSKRMNREDYVDATQRGIIRAMGAASFGSNANGTPDVTSATSSTSSANLANLKSPPLEHRSSSSSSIKTTSSGQKISIFGKKKHD